MLKEKEQLKALEERQNTKRMMIENLEKIRYKKEVELLQLEEERHMFNSKAKEEQLIESMTKEQQ